MAEMTIEDLSRRLERVERRCTRLRAALVLLVGVLFVGCVYLARNREVMIPDSLRLRSLIVDDAFGEPAVEITGQAHGGEIHFFQGQGVLKTVVGPGRLWTDAIESRELRAGRLILGDKATPEAIQIGCDRLGHPFLWLREASMGKAEVHLQLAGPGGGRLSFLDETGTARVLLGGFGGNSMLNLLGQNGKSSFGALVRQDGEVSASIVGGIGTRGITLIDDSDGSKIAFTTTEAKDCLSLGLRPDGLPVVRMADATGQDRIQLGVFGNDRVLLNILDKQGRDRAAFGFIDGKQPGAILAGETLDHHIAFLLQSDLVTGIDISGPGNRPRVILGDTALGSGLSIQDGAGVQRANLFVPREGQSALRLFNADGSPGWSSPE